MNAHNIKETYLNSSVGLRSAKKQTRQYRRVLRNTTSTQQSSATSLFPFLSVSLILVTLFVALNANRNSLRQQEEKIHITHPPAAEVTPERQKHAQKKLSYRFTMPLAALFSARDALTADGAALLNKSAYLLRSQPLHLQIIVRQSETTSARTMGQNLRRITHLQRFLLDEQAAATSFKAILSTGPSRKWNDEVEFIFRDTRDD